MSVHIITDEMKTTQLADAYVSRVHEAANYQTNITNYLIMFESLPQDEWPANLVQYKNTEPSKISVNLA